MNTDCATCEICGCPTVALHCGGSAGCYCSGCGNYRPSTTDFPPIEQDAGRYRVFVSAGDFRNRLHVKAVAEIAGVNFLGARKLLQEASPEVFAGQAVDVARVRNVLTTAGLSIGIEPVFPWRVAEIAIAADQVLPGIDLEYALSLAQSVIDRFEETPGEFAILRDATQEFADGWLFFYNTRAFVSGEQEEPTLAGNGPIFVTQQSEVFQLPSAYPWQQSLYLIMQKRCAVGIVENRCGT